MTEDQIHRARAAVLAMRAMIAATTAAVSTSLTPAELDARREMLDHMPEALLFASERA